MLLVIMIPSCARRETRHRMISTGCLPPIRARTAMDCLVTVRLMGAKARRMAAPFGGQVGRRRLGCGNQRRWKLCSWWGGLPAECSRTEVSMPWPMPLRN